MPLTKTQKTIREMVISILFAAANLVIILLLPANNFFEAGVGLVVFFYLLPLLYVRIVLKRRDGSIFGMHSIVPSPHVSVVAAATLSVGVALAYIFSRFSIAGYYRSDIIGFLGTDKVIALVVLNLMILLPIYFFVTTLSLGFMHYITRSLPDILRNILAWVYFGILFGSFMYLLMPGTALWYLFPVMVPAIGALWFYRGGMLYLVPLWMIMIKFAFDVLVLK